MYKSGYVVAIMANSSVLDEDESRKVTLPFGTEYKVRLINKNSERCAADLIINGEKIARFILNGGETSDIERYLDGDLRNGSRFKFTHLNDSAVKDKKDFDNGIVEVHFYKEAKKKEPIVIREDHHHWNYPKQDPWKFPWPNSPIWYGTTYTNGDINNKAIGSCVNNASMDNCVYTSCMAEGATVRGSVSDQKFTEVSGHEFESMATIIKMKIVNGEPQTASKYCSSCGRKRKDGDKYCGNCGNRI